VTRRATWLIGLAVLLAGCAVKPITPPPVVDVAQELTAAPAGNGGVLVDPGTPAEAGAATATGPAGPAGPRATETPPGAAPSSLPPAAAATATSVAATAAVVAASASPTPALIVVANVALVPAPTATRARAYSAVGANPAPTAVPPVSVAPPVSGDVAAAEMYTVALINAQRAARGLAALAANPTLMSIANSRVADMVARGYTGHNDPNTGVALGPALMRAAGFGGLVGENWYGTRLAPPANAEVAMQWFMTDPPHYQNILNPRYNGVGVGIAYNGQQWLLIQDFAGN
jgi:uncharacterized protein YkwD